MIINPYTSTLEDIWGYSTQFPLWVIADTRQEACILSRRIVCAEEGKLWDWQGLAEDDFTDLHYRIIYRACRWLESKGENCTQSNVITIAGLIGEEDGTPCPPARIRGTHRIALEMDRLWSLLTLDEYDHIGAVKAATKRRQVIENATEAINKVLRFASPDYYLGELAQLESVKSRKGRVTWK